MPSDAPSHRPENSARSPASRRKHWIVLIVLAAVLVGITGIGIRALYRHSQPNALIAAVEARNTSEIQRLLNAGVDPCGTVRRLNILREPGEPAFYRMSALLRSLHLNHQDITRSLLGSVKTLPNDISIYVLCAIRGGDWFALREFSRRGVPLGTTLHNGDPLMVYSVGGGSFGTLTCIAREMLSKGEPVPTQFSAALPKLTNEGVIAVICLLSDPPSTSGDPTNRTRTLAAIAALHADPHHPSTEDICGWPAWLVGLVLADSGEIGLRMEPDMVYKWTSAGGLSALDIIAATREAHVVAHFAQSAARRGDAASLRSALVAAAESLNWDATMALVDAGADPAGIQIFGVDIARFLRTTRGSSTSLDALRQIVGAQAP